MKITMGRQELLDAVNKVKTVVSPKSALPILSHILIEAKDGELKLTATDLKVSIECSVDCDVLEPGSMTVSAQRLHSVLAELPEGNLTLTLGDNNVISLESGRIHTKLFSMSSEEYPPVRNFEGTEPLVLSQKQLRKLFQKTSFAICTDQARYNLTGLLIEINGGKLVVVATDGRRMSLCSEKEGIPQGISVRVIVPGKMITELERLLKDDGDVNLYIDETQAAFQFDSLRLVTALIEGNFPNYDMVIPKKHDKEGVLDRVAFTEAVRRTRTMTNDKFNSVRFLIEEGNLTLNVVTPEVGEYQEDMPLDYKGGKVEIAFNPDFILEVLRRIEVDKIDIVFKDAMSPGLFRPHGSDKSSAYLNVIMPIRI